MIKNSELRNYIKRTQIKILTENKRIDEIKAAPNVEIMIQFKIGRCHQLKGDRKKHLSI